MSATPVITELRKTCTAAPSQWEGTLADGRDVYIRHRSGELRIEYGNRRIIIDEPQGNESSYISAADMQDVLSEFVAFDTGTNR